MSRLGYIKLYRAAWDAAQAEILRGPRAPWPQQAAVSDLCADLDASQKPVSASPRHWAARWGWHPQQASRFLSRLVKDCGWFTAENRLWPPDWVGWIHKMPATPVNPSDISRKSAPNLDCDGDVTEEEHKNNDLGGDCDGAERNYDSGGNAYDFKDLAAKLADLEIKNGKQIKHLAAYQAKIAARLAAQGGPDKEERQALGIIDKQAAAKIANKNEELAQMESHILSQKSQADELADLEKLHKSGDISEATYRRNLAGMGLEPEKLPENEVLPPEDWDFNLGEEFDKWAESQPNSAEWLQ